MANYFCLIAITLMIGNFVMLSNGKPRIRVITEDLSASQEKQRPLLYDKCTPQGHNCVDFEECCEKDDICTKVYEGDSPRHSKICSALW